MNIAPTFPVLPQKDDLAFSFFSPAASDNLFVVTGFSVSEALFELTTIDLQLASRRNDINLHDLIDQPGTLTVHDKYHGLRHFSGLIAGAVRDNEGHHHTAYSMTLLPVLHRLDHGSDARIFQQKTVVDIIQEVLALYGVIDVQWRTTGDHVAREYCVQYRETHLAFINRLCAEEGIWYMFEHGAEGRHSLVFYDNCRTCVPLPNQNSLEYNPSAGGNVKGPYCDQFSFREELRSTSWTQRDYSFHNPGYNQQHRKDRQEDNGSASDYAMYDYPGRYKRSNAGEPFTQHLMESTRVDASTGRGRTNSIHLAPNYVMELTEHSNDTYNIKYLLLSAHHSGSQPGATDEDAGDGTTHFTTSFTAMPWRLPYKPPQKTRPLVDGPQMAHVVGPPGEEIYCDEHGRVKVQFPWDRYGESNEHSSCWIRVASNWAGTMWGHISIPRIGQEVIVDFLEGDPDQPIITGRTYHAQNKTPYTLPDHKTKMVIRSDSHKADGYNEISFEDEGGKENMFFHAQKDQTFKVLNNRAKRVENNQTESIGSNKNVEVGGNHAEKIGGSMNISVGGGSGGALMGALGAVLAAGGKDGAAGAGATGNAAIGTFMSGIAAAGALAEAASGKGNSGFNAAADHFAEAGKDQQGAASKLGGILSSIMPMSGIVNSVIEKFQSKTIGVAKTEQIGVMKNTSVGHTQTTQVGKYKKILVGKELFIGVGGGKDKDGNEIPPKSILIMKDDGTILIKGVKIYADAESHIQLTSAMIDNN